jgi:hypothetical protein
MPEIERFNYTFEDGIWAMDQKPEGKWVRYSDHKRIVKELEARVQNLMTTREQAERFIRQHLSSAAWSGEKLMITFEQEDLIAALIGDVEAPTPSLSDAIKEAEKMRDENNRSYEYWKTISSNPDTDFGVLKFAAWAGEDERVITALKSLGPQRED